MFTPGSKPFKLVCVSIYGRESVNSEDEMNSVIDIIKKRRNLVSNATPEMAQTLNEAYGFVDPMELMG